MKFVLTMQITLKGPTLREPMIHNRVKIELNRTVPLTFTATPFKMEHFHDDCNRLTDLKQYSLFHTVYHLFFTIFCNVVYYLPEGWQDG